MRISIGHSKHTKHNNQAILNQSINLVNAIIKSDIFAEKISWTPINTGGTRKSSRKLILDHNTASFKVPFLSLLFDIFISLMPIVIEIMILFFIMLPIVKERIPFVESHFSNICIALAVTYFFRLSYSIKQYFKNELIPIKFDKKINYFQKGFLKKNNTPRSEQQKTVLDYLCDNASANISDIYALQIIPESIVETSHQNNVTRTRSFISYELNVVLKDGSRVNILDHGKIEKLTEDAQKLSQFLGKPLWSAA